MSKLTSYLIEAGEKPSLRRNLSAALTTLDHADRRALAALASVRGAGDGSPPSPKIIFAAAAVAA